MNESHVSFLAMTSKVSPSLFDSERLDGLLDEAGIDAVMICSKHDIQYLRAATASSSSTISTQ